MEVIKVEREALLLDMVEKEKLCQCLNYCKHRLQKHPECGLKIKIKFVNYMLINLKEKNEDQFIEFEANYAKGETHGNTIVKQED